MKLFLGIIVSRLSSNQHCYFGLKKWFLISVKLSNAIPCIRGEILEDSSTTPSLTCSFADPV